MPNPNPKRLGNVQALRALAAIAVIVGHSGGMNIIHVPPMLQACGYSGVDVFFVISGFIISQTAIRPDISRADAGAFLLKRYWRVYPLYWIALIAVVVFSRNVLPLQYPLVACNKPQAHYLLLLTQSNCWIPPAWTLKFELYFYTAFAAALLVAPRRVFPVIAAAMPSLPNPSMLVAHNAAGHEFIPLHGASDIGKDGKRIGKQPLYNAWPTKAAMTLEAAVSHMQAGWNVGVRLRDTDLVIDVDPRNFDAGDDPVARLWNDFALPDCPFVRTGGGGFHFYLRKPSDLEVVDKLTAYKGIEFKSKGRQVVAAGSIHPDTGRLYALDDDPIALLLSEASEATTVLVDAIKRPISAASSGEPGDITPEQLARLLSVHSVLKYNGRHDDWLRIMMAAHHGTNGEGVDEFVMWSLGDPDYADHEASIRDRWNSLVVKPGGVTLGTLLKALADDGHGAFIEEVLRAPAVDDFADDLPAEIVPPTFMEKAGRIESNYRNTQRAVEAGGLGVAYDELANRAVLRAERLPWTRDIGRELNDDLIRIVREWIMEQFGFEPKKDDVSDVLFALATKHTFNPVVEYLDGLIWDGVERVNALLPGYFGSADGAYERAVGRKLMLAAVRRARHPGTKFDTVPILEGKQGSGRLGFQHKANVRVGGLSVTGYISADDPLFGG